MKFPKDDCSILKIAEILKKGNVVVIPTDTVYGFSGLAEFGDENIKSTVKKIALIKGRDENKPLIRLVSSPEDVEYYSSIKIPSAVREKWPGPLTVIVPLKKEFASENMETAAFRCPGDLWLRKLIESCGAPLFSTSVNRSGLPVLEKINDICNEFEAEVGAVVDNGDAQGGVPSTLIKLEGESWTVLRQGLLKI